MATRASAPPTARIGPRAQAALLEEQTLAYLKLVTRALERLARQRTDRTTGQPQWDVPVIKDTLSAVLVRDNGAAYTQAEGRIPAADLPRVRKTIALALAGLEQHWPSKFYLRVMLTEWWPEMRKYASRELLSKKQRSNPAT